MRKIILSVATLATSALMFTGLTSVPAQAADPVEVTVTIQTDGTPVGAWEGQLEIYEYLPEFGRWEDNQSSHTDPFGNVYAQLDPGEYRFCFVASDPEYGQTCHGGAEVLDATTVDLQADLNLGVINLTKKPLANTSAMVVKGQPVVGKRLTLDMDSVTPYPNVVQIYWVRDGAPPVTPGDGPIGQTVGMGSEYVVRPADAGHTLSAVLMFMDSQVRGPFVMEWSTFAMTPATGVVLMPVGFSDAPRMAAKRWKKGKVASYVVPSDLPVGVTASFQWLRNGQAIPGQTTPRHKITKRDRRKRLSLRVTYSRPGYADTVMETPPSPRIKR